ncbi:unnamed protein product, partial [Thlaspi arvense]
MMCLRKRLQRQLQLQIERPIRRVTTRASQDYIERALKEDPLHFRKLYRMGPDIFLKLCGLIRERKILTDTRYISLEEIVASFLLIVGQNSRYCYTRNTFKRSKFAMSYNFHKKFCRSDNFPEETNSSDEEEDLEEVNNNNEEVGKKVLVTHDQQREHANQLRATIAIKIFLHCFAAMATALVMNGESKKQPRPGRGGFQGRGLTEEEARVRAISEVVSTMIERSHRNENVDLNAIKTAACRKYGLARS